MIVSVRLSAVLSGLRESLPRISTFIAPETSLFGRAPVIFENGSVRATCASRWWAYWKRKNVPPPTINASARTTTRAIRPHRGRRLRRYGCPPGPYPFEPGGRGPPGPPGPAAPSGSRTYGFRVPEVGIVARPDTRPAGVAVPETGAPATEPGTRALPEGVEADMLPRVRTERQASSHSVFFAAHSGDVPGFLTAGRGSTRSCAAARPRARPPARTRGPGERAPGRAGAARGRPARGS